MGFVIKMNKGQKKYIITEEEKELLLWNINNRSLMDAKWFLNNLREFIDQEEIIKELEKENKAKDEEIENLIKKILGEEK
jgi:hypothetical protein